ncbi:CECR2 histone acetyl-lysine reader dikar isoform X2 [Anticarsia gemmatalis]|uniref:CECR2 histone acetyl-lysine reader dikar isoform X2 n=1 Tax=Anticarsia gemmatalis TaxID=129554 RepID=UPI003F767AEA
MEDIQSWWEVPSIAYFCSLFRSAFNLLDFDIEDLEEALLTDGTEESASSLLTELIVRLLNGCLGNNDISAFNYQMYLRRLFRQKCQERGRYNPFNTDIDFQFLPLRTKVEILYALCDFRLDGEDVFEIFKNLEAESLRVEPLGWDDNYSAYWYFYGTRLYREDIINKKKGKNRKKKFKENRKRGWFYGDDWLDDDDSERVWQVVCFTQEDWTHLTEKFSKATSKVEKELFHSLTQNFLPEIPRLFQEKERLQRKRLLELAPRRTSSRVLQKIKQKEEETKQSTHDGKEENERKETPDIARENRARRRNLLRSKSDSSDSSEDSTSAKEEEPREKEKVKEVEEEDEEEDEEMPQKMTKPSKSHEKRSKNSSGSQKGEPPPEPLIKTGRKTNNSLASATGQIVIPDNDEPVSSTRKKLKTSQIFGQTDEDIQTDMYKVLKQLTAHDDAWPFMDPVEEEYAPNYYAVIRRPMDLRKMEERLDTGYYTDFSMFKADFKLIVNNCRLYNGQDNEYTVMVDNLQAAFDRLTERYIHRVSSSDEEIAVEYQLPTPSRKHKLKSSESPSHHHKRKKRKSHSDAGEPKSSSSDAVPEEKHEEEEEVEDMAEPETKKTKESRKSKQKGKKKRKGHHRHGKHSKNHRKDSHISEHSESSKSKHSKKQKHSKNKDKEGKKSKQKKKKAKHQEVEPPEVIKRSVSQESLESSNRSRSASPLPSIHTPTPSPTELDQGELPDQLNDPDFVKDKYDKIKERRRHAAKDAWESLFDYKQKTVDKQKQNLNIPEKDKNQKLRETIEKLKAKNEKYKDSSLFNSLFSGNQSNADKMSESSNTNDLTIREDSDDEPSDSQAVAKSAPKKGGKKNSTKNESASEALEQAVKDISKWLDDAPKGSNTSSPCDSPAQTISTEDHENSRLDDDLSQGEKPHVRKDFSRKRPSSREPKLVKRREIQRTIDRLQPGKSKGNLLTNMVNKNTEKAEETSSLGSQNKARDPSKPEESSPKLSLGSVLPTVEFSLGTDHNFTNNDEGKTEDLKESCKTAITEKKEEKVEDVPSEKKTEEVAVQASKKDAEVETDPQIPTKPNQEKATPNLSAWFKAFGAPKTTTSTTAAVPKKKVEEVDAETKVTETGNSEAKPSSPKNTVKYDSPTGPDTPNPDGGDSPLPNVGTTPRQRRTSTGSSVSERSSFSQDLDSPRHQMSHTSPLLRSPASPRTEDFQKITYPIINGTVRAGFYQDTTSIKSSPEKSCSPREAPQSPYSPYSQHVYASNNVTGSATPNYFIDHNKSPLPTYTQNPPPYYDTAKATAVNKTTRNHEDYTSMAPESYQQTQYTGPYSPAYSPYSQTPASSYSQAQHSPQTTTPTSTVSTNATPLTADSKAQLFPVKKRTYSEPEHTPLPAIKVPENNKDVTVPPKNDYPKMASLTHSLSSITPTSVDDIALALSEKSEMTKLNNLRDKTTVEYATENRDNLKYDNSETLQNTKINISIENKPTDMVNMGYLDPDGARRSSNDQITSHSHEVDYLPREIPKSNANSHHKTYDVDAIAINLGALQKTIAKTINPTNIPPAHSQERLHSEINLNQNLVHAHHNQYDSISGGQSISNFSISDIDLANKKLYACNTTPSSAAIDYGNWKMTSQIRKPDLLPSDYSTAYSANSAEKLKNEINAANTSAVAYNKNVQHQQYNSFNVARPTLQRAPEIQQNLPGELRIPNPRGLLKSDHIMTTSTSHNNNDVISKNIDTHAKSQKTEKLIQNHPLVTSNPYKTPYSNPAALPLESLRNLPNIPQMLERYTNDERYLSTFASSGSSLYHDKSFQMAQMFNKSISSDVHPVSTSASIYSQPAISMSKDNSIYKTSSVPTPQLDPKAKNKRKRTSDATKQAAQIAASQAYHQSSCNTDVLSSVKSSMMTGNAFNFGGSTNMGLAGGLYDNGSFSMDDFRNTQQQHQLMAANYMVAAVAHQQRSNVDVSAEKLVKPAHQNSAHTPSTFPFIGHTQVRAGYPFVGSDPTSELYQQYLQREQILRQTGAQIMSLYPGSYPTNLGVRQPYDINRHSWL